MTMNSGVQVSSAPDESSQDPYVRAYRLVHRDHNYAVAEIIVGELLAAATANGKAGLLTSATWLLQDLRHHRTQVRQNGCFRQPREPRPMKEGSLPIEMAGDL